MNPTNTNQRRIAPSFGVLPAEIFGHQKCMPPRYPMTIPPTIMSEMGHDEICVVDMDVHYQATATKSPVMPPMVKSPMNPNA